MARENISLGLRKRDDTNFSGIRCEASRNRLGTSTLTRKDSLIRARSSNSQVPASHNKTTRRTSPTTFASSVLTCSPVRIPAEWRFAARRRSATGLPNFLEFVFAYQVRLFKICA